MGCGFRKLVGIVVGVDFFGDSYCFGCVFRWGGDDDFGD